MKKPDILENIGLNTNEIAIYKMLVKAGPSLISKISVETGLNRPLIYKAFPSLMEKGLIGTIPKGKYRLYIAESPTILSTIFDGMKDGLEKEILKLKRAYGGQNKNKLLFRHIDGKYAIRKLFEETLLKMPVGSIYFRYATISTLDYENRKSFLPRNYSYIRDQRKLERLIITNEFTKSQKKLKLGREVKVIPKDFDLFDYNINMGIFGDRVVINDYETETAAVIENKRFADLQKKIFQLLFRKL